MDKKWIYTDDGRLKRIIIEDNEYNLFGTERGSAKTIIKEYNPPGKFIGKRMPVPSRRQLNSEL